MAYITKRGSSYGVRYTYQDEQGKNCNKWESFSTKEEAINRKKQIEHELANGTFLIPSTITVKEFLMEWLPKQCNKHKWAPQTYQSNLGTVQNLIIPYIGDMQMQKLKPYHLEDLYATLSKTPCGQYLEGKKQVLSEKQQQRFLSGTTIHEVHRLLRTAFQYAVEWGILIKSPVPVDSPKKSIQERAIWDADEMWAALASMEDPILHLAVHLTLVGALREGEVAGLTSEDLDFEGADGTGTFRINKCMQRVQKISLAKTGKDCILQEFEDKREGSTTTLVLKKTKAASSNRTIFMTAVLKEELKHWLKRLEMDEAVDPERYRNSGMLLRLPNGLAVEPILIRKKFIKWQDEHPEFTRIVFHGLRHSSATYQLMISGGDVKAVQGTTGHASANLLVNTYAHIQQDSRKKLGKKFEEGFYKPGATLVQAAPVEAEPTISVSALLELLKDADPSVKAQLRLALLTRIAKNSTNCRVIHRLTPSDTKNADRAKTVQRPCKWCIKRKSHEESCDSSWDFCALEGTRIPGPLIKRAYFDGFLYPNSLQNARFDDIFSQLRPVSAPHAFSSCRIFVALFCGTITGTFFISYDKQDFCSHNFGRMGLHGLAALERAFSGGHPALFPDAAPIKISPE